MNRIKTNAEVRATRGTIRAKYYYWDFVVNGFLKPKSTFKASFSKRKGEREFESRRVFEPH